MLNADKLISRYCKQNEEERKNELTLATKIVSDYLYACDLDEKECLSFFLNIVRLFVSADRKCGREEYELFKQIINVEIDYDSFFEFTNAGASNRFVKEMDEIIDRFDAKTKNAVCVIGLSIICSDGIVHDSERKLLQLVLDD